MGLKSLLEFQVFQTGLSNQKIPQNDKGSKNHFGFLGQVDFNKSNTTRMVFFYQPKGGVFYQPQGGAFD
jgi:hypothetical protein